MKLLLAGEGSTELGDWFNEPQYRRGPNARGPGVLEALLDRVAPGRWNVLEGMQWKLVRSYRAGQHRQAETRRVLGLALVAGELGCDAVVFVRDRDGDVQREKDIERGIQEASEAFQPVVIGGVAIEEVEAWILALCGATRSENHADPKKVLADRYGIRDLAGMVEVIGKAPIGCDSLGALPSAATSLRIWLERVCAAFRTSE